MLTIHNGGRGFDRRAFLQIGGLALGGLTLPGLLAARARAAEGNRLLADKSVVFLFLHGGPSQFETFDPKMSAPAEIRSATGETQTALPGVTFGATFPRLAALADRLAVVRSYQPGDANHNIKPVVCPDTFGANLGAVYSRMAGPNNPRNGIPTNVVLFPRSVDPSTQAGTMNFGRFGDVGPFGSACAPFDPSGGGDLRKDLTLTLPMTQLEDRRSLLAQLDQLKRGLADADELEAMDRTRAQAFDAVLGGAAEAFDLSKEHPAVVDRYDTAPLVRPENIDKKWKNYNNYVDNAKSLGKLLLLARRLCERGAGFVTVTTNFVWDMHADENNAPCAEGMRYMAPPLDYAVSAFIEDLEARGLTDRILLVACGEMGRTPKLNGKGGRDHWGELGPLLLAGGGLNMGHVVGQSTRDGGRPLSEPIRVKNVIGTVLHTLFDVGALRLVPGAPREIAQTMTGYEPIAELMA